MVTPSQPLLGLRELTRLGDHGRRLMDAVTMQVRAGETVGVQGRSGAGKTLLLRALAALDPVDTCLQWRGQILQPDKVPQFRAHVMYLAQSHGFDDARVVEVLKIPFDWTTHADKQFDRGRAELLLRQVGRSAEFLEQRARDLSGGEAAIVALVRAMLLDPTVLLLDEPTSAMDADTSSAVEAMVRQWTDDQRACVWVSHQSDQLRRVATRTVRMDQGKLVAGH